MKLFSGFSTTVPHPSRQFFDLQQFAFWCQEKVNLPPSVKASHLRADVRCGRETFTCGEVFKRGAEILKGSRPGTDDGDTFSHVSTSLQINTMVYFRTKLSCFLYGNICFNLLQPSRLVDIVFLNSFLASRSFQYFSEGRGHKYLDRPLFPCLFFRKSAFLISNFRNFLMNCLQPIKYPKALSYHKSVLFF